MLSDFINASASGVGKVSPAATSTGTVGTATANRCLVSTTVSENGTLINCADGEKHGESYSKEMLKMRATYQGIGWNFTSDWAMQETESYPYNKAQTAPPVITSDITSGTVMLRGKCISGGRVFVEIGDDMFEADCEGTSWSMRVNPLRSGEIIRINAISPDLSPSYLVIETVKYPGAGTEENPYLVYTVFDFKNIGGEGYYKLMNDLDLSDEKNWTPIGKLKPSVSNIDGDNHTIKGLTVNLGTASYAGLFSNMRNATIKNLNIENANITGGNYAAILCGSMVNVSVENCNLNGEVNGKNYVGAITGSGSGLKVKTSSADVTIVGTTNVGGVAGSLINGSEVYGFNMHANVTGAQNVGGICGNISEDGTIKSTSVAGEITATATNAIVGGIAGINLGTIEDCFATADVQATETSNDGYLGGIVGQNKGVIEKCYSSGELSGQRRAAGISGYNIGASATTKGCVAANDRIRMSGENPIAMRVVGGSSDGAPYPEISDNYASASMMLSFNDVPQDIYDDPYNGLGKPSSTLKERSTYENLGWDFASTWRISGDALPQLVATSNGGGNATGYDNYLTIDPINAYGGDELDFVVNLHNRDDISAFQFDICLPTGITLILDEDGEPIIDRGDRLHRSHSIDYRIYPNGEMRVLIASMSNALINGTDGEVCHIALKVNEHIVNGTYNIMLKNVFLTDDKATNIVGPVTLAPVGILNDWMETSDIKGMCGKNTTLAVSMNNRSEISGFQFDMLIPEGLTIAKNAIGEPDITFGDRSSQPRHEILMKTRADGTTRFIVHSMENNLFDGHNGVAFTVNFDIADAVKPGQYPIEFTNVYLVAPNATSVKAPDFISMLTVDPKKTKGDVNRDGIINTADLSGTTMLLLGKNDDNIDFYCADLDDNNVINAIDFNAEGQLILDSRYNIKQKVAAKISSDDFEKTPNFYVFIEPFTIKPGEEKEIKIMMHNPESPVTNSQFDLFLPEGLDCGLFDDPLDENDFFMECGSRANKRKHTTLGANRQPNGEVRYLIASLTLVEFTGTYGDILIITIKADENVRPGTYSAFMDWMFASDKVASSYMAEKYEFSITVEGEQPETLALRGRIDEDAEEEFNAYLSKNGDITSLDLTGIIGTHSQTPVKFYSANPNMLIFKSKDANIGNTVNVVDEDMNAVEIVLSDGHPFNTELEFTTDRISYSREMTKDKLESIMLPFELNKASIPTKINVFKKYDNDTKRFIFDEDPDNEQLAENTPAIFLSPIDGTLNITANNVSVLPDKNRESAEKYTFKGNYTRMTAPEQWYHPTGKKSFEKVETLMPFRAYAIADETIPELTHSNDGSSGVNAVGFDACSECVIYNLQGIRVRAKIEKLPKGMYIINGKKVAIK